MTNTYKRHRFPPDVISYAVWLYHRLKQRHGGYGDTLYLDKVFVKINGKQQYLRRAVDQDGEVVDVYLQARRDGAAAEFDQLDEQKQTEKPDCDKRHYGCCNNPSHQTTTTIKNDFLIPRNPLVSVSQRLVFMSPQIHFILL